MKIILILTFLPFGVYAEDIKKSDIVLSELVEQSPELKQLGDKADKAWEDYYQAIVELIEQSPELKQLKNKAGKTWQEYHETMEETKQLPEA